MYGFINIYIYMYIYIYIKLGAMTVARSYVSITFGAVGAATTDGSSDHLDSNLMLSCYSGNIRFNIGFLI